MGLLPRRYDEQRKLTGVSVWTVGALMLGVWLIPALLAAFETVAFWRMADRPQPAWLAVALQAPQWVAYALLTPLILHASETKWLRRISSLALLGHTLLALAAGLVYAFVAALVWHNLSPFPTGRPFAQTMLAWYLSALPIIVLSYAAIVGGSRALYWFARSRTAETKLAGARLDALRMQLQPHFLFNTLNALTVLVRDRDYAAAEQSLTLLSGLLRDALRQDARHTIPLGEELDFARRYLALEQLRFPDRLRVRYQVPPALENALVPAMILQPLIENAIRHGISQHAHAGALQIAATALDGALTLEVTNDGASPNARSNGGGVGIANTLERLRVLYGDAASFALTPLAEGGGRARVQLPLEMQHV